MITPSATLSKSMVNLEISMWKLPPYLKYIIFKMRNMKMISFEVLSNRFCRLWIKKDNILYRINKLIKEKISEINVYSLLILTTLEISMTLFLFRKLAHTSK